MAGADKGWVLFDGKPLISQVVERIAPQVEELIINANRNCERYRALGCRVIADQLPGFAGPLAGLQTALTEARYPLVTVVPCDSPFLPNDLVARLYAALIESHADLATVSTGGRVQPIFGLCWKRLLPHLSAFLDSGQRQVSAWQQSLKTTVVSFDDQASAFRNLNTTEDLLVRTGVASADAG